MRIVGVSIRERVCLPIGLGYFRAKPSPVWIPQLFLNLVIILLLAYEDGTDRVFRNVCILNSDAGELPRRKHTTYRTRRKLEIKNNLIYSLKARNQLPSVLQLDPSVNPYPANVENMVSS